MNLTFDNDTRTIVQKLVKKNLKADKTRNVLIIITIAFATCLIMATILYFFFGQRASRNSAEGMYQANISDLDEKTACIIQSDDRVLAGFSYLMGMIDYGEYKVAVRSMDENLMQLAKYPAIDGRLPEVENEVAVTQALLDRKGLSSGIGDTIRLNLTGDEQCYTVCGILSVTESNYSIYVTSSFVKNNAERPIYSAYIHAKGTDALSEEFPKKVLKNIFVV